jgi:AmiR/NasT family two-component response regulator
VSAEHVAAEDPYERIAALEAELHHLQTAMESRAVIEQAKGIIVASARCSPEDAFALLVQQSQATNRKLREIAQEIVSSHYDQLRSTR